ncbi:MAG: response regulator, partial [Thermoleophilia bacterium]
MPEPGLRVLLADDDPLSREFLADALEAAGAEVLAVDDGQAAVKQLRRGSFDLVMTDLRMPRKDGMAVLRAAKAVDRSLPVVLVTAHGTVDVAVHALREGVDDVLVKPVQCEQIRLLLERLRKRSLLLAENEYLRREDDGGEAFPSRNPRMRAID